MTHWIEWGHTAHLCCEKWFSWGRQSLIHLQPKPNSSQLGPPPFFFIFQLSIRNEKRELIYPFQEGDSPLIVAVQENFNHILSLILNYYEQKTVLFFVTYFDNCLNILMVYFIQGNKKEREQIFINDYPWSQQSFLFFWSPLFDFFFSYFFLEFAKEKKLSNRGKEWKYRRCQTPSQTRLSSWSFRC